MNQDVFLSTNFHELALMFFFSTYLGYLHVFFGQKSTFFGYIFYGFIVVDIMIKSSISSITSGGVSEVLEVSRESVDGLLNKLWFI